ncbi:MAG: response regulator [Calditrichaeota bacterium]|nr:MAG: response regulator [Calditrichota bacterium]MBL1204694.1 response regulator [Calditrichota bacterium]NOG44522.1 response regulator [Calditrichota bacterium]
MNEQGRILIADDEETFLFATAELLRKNGYLCDCATDANAASKLLEKNKYDLLISDIKMPNNADLKLVKSIEKREDNLQVILVTGYPSLDTALQSVHLPVCAYLLKPIDFDSLLTHVKKAIGIRQIQNTITDAKSRLAEIHTVSSQIDDSMNSQNKRSAEFSTDSFLDLSFKNITGSLSDIEKLFNISQDKEKLINTNDNQFHLFKENSKDVLKKAVQETISVLEKTKRSFKSKELGELRKKLESLQV